MIDEGLSEDLEDECRSVSGRLWGGKGIHMNSKELMEQYSGLYFNSLIDILDYAPGVLL